VPGVSPPFQAFVLDLLAPLSPVARRMFRGAGIFTGGIMFALLVRDTMYLRVDDTTRPRFKSAGSEPFSYIRRGQSVSLDGYYAVPEVLFDQPDELLIWARDAVAAARAAPRRR
jgi:DNA transformation protein